MIVSQVVAIKSSYKKVRPNTGMQPMFTRTAFNNVDLYFGVLGRLSRLVFNERVNTADAYRWATRLLPTFPWSKL